VTCWLTWQGSSLPQMPWVGWRRLPWVGWKLKPSNLASEALIVREAESAARLASDKFLEATI